LASANYRDCRAAKRYALSPARVRPDPTGSASCCVHCKMRRFAVALITLLAAGVTSAQTPGLGQTRPAAPDTPSETAPADRPLNVPQTPPESASQKTETDRTLARCRELEGNARETCMRDERTPGAGATRRPEPPTAPPPQNPR
jgi:hypothetical protein